MLGMIQRKDGVLPTDLPPRLVSGIIGPMIRSKGGVDVEAGRYNNDPPIRSTIRKVVAKPAGTCRIHHMINENPTPPQDQAMDAYWLALAARLETDSADIGCEFDS